MNVFAFFIAAITATYFARYAIKTNYLSEMINDRTQGIDQVPERLIAVVKMFGSSPSEWGAMWEAAGSQWVYTPMWLPQIPMSIGTVLLAVALWDHLYRLLITFENPIRTEKVDSDVSADESRKTWCYRQCSSRRASIMSEIFATIVFLFVLFTLLGTSVWIGLALMGVAWVGMELQHLDL